MAQSDFTDLKGALARTLGLAASHGRGSLLEPLWREAVGPLAAHSRPIELREGVLQVEVDAELLAELELAREPIRVRLEQRLGRNAVRRIEVVARR